MPRVCVAEVGKPCVSVEVRSKLVEGVVWRKCYCIGESVCYWLEKILWTRDGEELTTRYDEGLH